PDHAGGAVDGTAGLGSEHDTVTLDDIPNRTPQPFSNSIEPALDVSILDPPPPPVTAPLPVLSAFGVSQTWTSQDSYPRQVADVNGDGLADIVGFGEAGAYVALATGGGHFAAPFLALSAFGVSGTWTSQDRYPRAVADVNGDGMADIVGFGEAGAYVALATGGGQFAAPFLAVPAFGVAQTWTSQDKY